MKPAAALPIYRMVLQFAISHQMPFFTHREKKKAFEAYAARN